MIEYRFMREVWLKVVRVGAFQNSLGEHRISLELPLFNSQPRLHRSRVVIRNTNAERADMIEKEIAPVFRGQQHKRLDICTIKLLPHRPIGTMNGINLILLACRFPEVAFTGIELTEAGHRAALNFQKEAALPEAMREYAPLPLADPTAFRRITFLQGNAAQLPFADGQFDLLFSVLALEQMERIRRQVLLEFARVAGRHTLMIEPFRDVNAAFWRRSYVFGRGYFRGDVAGLRGFGLSPILAVDDFPQEYFMHACAVLAEKDAQSCFSV